MQLDPYAAIMKKYNITPQAGSGQPVSSADDFAAFMNKTGSYAPKVAPIATNTANPIAETGQNYMDNVAPAASDVNDLAKGFSGGAADDGAPEGNLGKAVDAFKSGDIANGIERSTLGVDHDAVQAFFAPIAAPIQTLLSYATAASASGSPSPTADVVNSPEAIAARKAITDWGAQHPDAMRMLGDVFNVGGAALGSNSLDATVSDTANSVKNAVTDTATGVKNAVSSAKDAVMGTPATQSADQLAKISDMIAPKPTIAEARLAQQQGRLVAPGKSGIFTEGDPGKILPSARQTASASTIQRLIPDADTMDQPTLYTATKAKVTDLATKLQPQMEATPIPQTVIDKIGTDTQNLFKTQTSEALATDEPNIAKLQANFQKFLAKSKTDNFKDLWDTAKNYDASIPDNVKNATEASSHELTMQKDIWMQNRAVIRSAINDTVDGMGDTSKQAFSDMRDLYNAQSGMDTTAKVAKVGTKSKVSQFFDTPTGKIIKYGAEGTGVVEVGKKLMTGGF